MPHWIAKASRVDVFCQVGLELEVGWVPKILSRSGNPKVQPGGKGFCDVGKNVKALDVPKGKVDRSMGDVHAGGNPHYHLGPSRYIQAGEAILDVLIENDSNHAEFYLKNFDKTKSEIEAVKAEAESILKNSRELKIMAYHSEFSYFIDEFKLNYIGDIEATPGVPPSAGRLARVSIEAKTKKVDLALYTRTNPKKIINRFSDMSGVKTVELTVYLLKEGGVSSYKDLIIGIAKRISKIEKK